MAVPSLLRTVTYRVDVETTSELTRGRTVVDLYTQTGRPVNAEVAHEIDRSAFIDLLVDAVAIVGRRTG